MKLDESKLKCLNLSLEYAKVLHRIPLNKYLERIIFKDEDDFSIFPKDDERVGEHTIRVFLGKDVVPPMIYLHVDGRFAAQYSYFDEEFAERSDIDLDL